MNDQNRLNKFFSNLKKLFQSQVFHSFWFSTTSAKFLFPELIHLDTENQHSALLLPLNTNFAQQQCSSQALTSSNVFKMSYWFQIKNSKSNINIDNRSSFIKHFDDDESEIFSLPEPPKPPSSIQNVHNYSNLMYDNLFDYWANDRVLGPVTQYLPLLNYDKVSLFRVSSSNFCKESNNCTKQDKHGFETFNSCLARAHSVSSFFDSTKNAVISNVQRHKSLFDVLMNEECALVKNCLNTNLDRLVSKMQKHDLMKSDLETLYLDRGVSSKLDIVKDRSLYCNLFRCEVSFMTMVYIILNRLDKIGKLNRFVQ